MLKSLLLQTRSISLLSLYGHLGKTCILARYYSTSGTGTMSSQSQGGFKIYHSKAYRSGRCTWLVEEMGVDKEVEIIEIDPVTCSTAEREKYIQEVNPHGQVPAMVTPGGYIMTESAAICFYLAEYFNKCLPSEAEKSAYYHWGIHGVTAIDAQLDKLYLPMFHAHKLNVPVEVLDQQDVNNTKHKVKVWLGALNKQLKDRPYICGDKFTAADAVVGYTAFYASITDRHYNDSMLNSGQFPNVTNYVEKFLKNPAFVRNCGSKLDWP